MIKSFTALLLVWYLIVQKILGSKKLVQIFAFLLPFKSLVFDVGLMIWAFYVPLSLMGIKLCMTKTKFKLPPLTLELFIYLVCSTLIITFLFIPSFAENAHYAGFFRNQGRFISALIRYVVFDFGILIIIYNSVVNHDQIIRTLRSYLYGLTVLVLLGIIQIMIFILSGIDIYPLRMVEGVAQSAPIIGVYSEEFSSIRMYSLGGEPKGLGSSLCVGLSVLLFSWSYGMKIVKYHLGLIGFFFIGLVLTFSRSGYGMFLVLIIFLTLSFLLKNRKIISKVFLRISLPVVGFLLCISPIIVEFVKTRFLVKNAGLFSEHVDVAIQEFFISQPLWLIFGSGTGNVHHLISPYLTGPLTIMQGHVFVSRYGYSRLLSESGIIGFVIFTAIFAIIVYRLNRIMNDRLSKMFKWVILSLVAFFMLRNNYVLSELMFLGALSLAYWHICHSVSVRHER